MNLQINIPDINIVFYFVIVFKLILSIGIGYILGRERKKHDKSGGGSRTLAIVSLASCLIALLTLEITKMNPETFNFSRLMAYGIVSIGFLGSGVIVQNKGKLDGITTASLIWASVPINYMIGLGYYFYGLIAAGLIYIILESKYWKIKRGIEYENS